MPLVSQVREWITSHIVAPSNSPSQFEAPALNDIAKWSIASFTLVGAVVTFFGIQEGALDRLLRADPVAALWVFILVGIGVVCGLLAPAFAASGRVYVHWIPLAIATLGLISWRLLPDIKKSPGGKATSSVAEFSDTSDIPAWLAAALLVLLVIIAGLLYRIPVPTTAAMLLIAVASISMGLYGATKLSVTSKSLPSDPALTAAIEGDPGRQVIKILVTAARRDGRPLHISVVGAGGTSPDTEVRLGEASAIPDAAGNVSQTSAFPVKPSRWRTIITRMCDGEEPCGPTAKSVTLSGNLPDENPRVSGSLKSSSTPSGADAEIKVDALRQDSRVRGIIYRLRNSRKELVTTAVLAGDENGSATWTSGTTRTIRGDQLILAYESCKMAAALQCQGDTELAHYVHL